MHALRAPAAMPLAILALTLAGLALVGLTGGYSHFVIALVALTTVAGTGLNVLLGLTGLISFGHAGFYALGAYASAILTGAACPSGSPCRRPACSPASSGPASRCRPCG